MICRIGLLALIAAACAGPKQGGKAAPPGPTAEDREIAQLLATARRGERRWQEEAAVQRALREKVLAVSSAAGLALARKELNTLANRSLLQVLAHEDGEPGSGTYIRSHPVTLTLAGQPRALVNLLLAFERESPRFRLGDLALHRHRAADSARYEATLSVDVLERIAVPPPLLPPPVTPSVPLAHREAVKVLRGHILRLDKALTVGMQRSAKLRKAAEETRGGAPVLSGPLAALFPKGSPATVQSATFHGGQLTATGHAATEEDGRLWVEAVERHAATAPGLVVSMELKPLEDGTWIQSVELAGAIASSDAARTSR